MKPWHLYLIRTRLNSLYAGVTTDVERRFQEHSEGGKKAAKYLRSKMPLKLVYQARIGSHSMALQAECRVKKMQKQRKEEIVRRSPEARQLMTILGL